jgi:hypothetical protein
MSTSEKLSQDWLEIVKHDEAFLQQFGASDNAPTSLQKGLRQGSWRRRVRYLFVPFPQAIWGEGGDMTLGEFYLLGYLLRHAMIFERTSLIFDDDELLYGHRSRSGERLDRGCGLQSRNALKAARSRLEAKGWIRSAKHRSGRCYEMVLLRSAVIEGDGSSSLAPAQKSTPNSETTSTPTQDSNSDSRLIQKR